MEVMACLNSIEKLREIRIDMIRGPTFGSMLTAVDVLYEWRRRGQVISHSAQKYEAACAAL